MNGWRKLIETEKEKLEKFYSFQTKFISGFFRIWQLIGCIAIIVGIVEIIKSGDFWSAFGIVCGLVFASLFFIVFPGWLIKGPINRELNSVKNDSIRGYETMAIEKKEMRYRRDGKVKINYKILVNVNINGENTEKWIDTTHKAYEMISEGDLVLIVTSDIRYPVYMSVYDLKLEAIEFDNFE